MAEKPNLNVVFVGHVDHGKSTTVGRLLFDSGLISETELKKLREIAEKVGKAGFEFAFVMDRLKEERERGLTIDLAYKKLVTKKYQITIIDAPGHRDFVKNMITGASQADAAFLVVAASEGVMQQTIDHIHLCRVMGVSQMAVIINKMDVVNYDEKKFNEVKQDVSKHLQMAGYKQDKINFIPASAYYGENIVKPSEKMKWYNGPTVLDQFDLFELPKQPVDMPLRMPIQEVYSITGVGTVPVGKIVCGKMKPGDKVIILPARTGRGIVGEVKSIEMHHQALSEAFAGDNVGVNIRGVGKQDIDRGDVIAHVDSAPAVVEEFIAQVVILDHPTIIAQGYTPVLHVHTAQVPVKFEELQKKIDPRTGQVIQEKPEFLKKGESAIVKLRPLKPLVIEPQKVNPHLSRFAIRDAGRTVAAGVCIEIKPKQI
jgi:elongation factor 1-alpha